MERIITTNHHEVHTSQEELFSRVQIFFDDFPRETWLPALWKIIKNYTAPKYATWEEALHEQDVQIFIHLLVMLDDLEPTFKENLSLQDHQPTPDISPRLPAA